MTTANERNLQVLHADVISALSRVYPELTAATNLVPQWTKNPRGEMAELSDLSGHLANVRKLELAMPIVAPMKAGKSTLINAIVGYQLLPSRANPMTTLPTKIVLIDDMDLRKPELEIPVSLNDLCSRAEQAIAEKVQSGWQVPEGHSYLGDLAARIASGDLPSLQPTYSGVEAVHGILARLNDQMRLLTFARPDLNLLSEVEELPVLRTGSQHSYHAGDSMAGRLVIIDTPGPNEKEMALRLGDSLERQLAASHVVLVMLDYTQMNAAAAQDIRDRLDRHLAIIGPGRLFGVVNKVDERKRGTDLSQADTYENARISLGLTPELAEGRIFETVAHWGVIGSRVIAALADGPGDDLSSVPAMRALWKELHPLDEDDEITEGLRETTPGRAERDARRLLSRSGVSVLVESAIARLRAGVAPTVMASALDRFIAALTDLREVVELERRGAARDRATLRRELETLEREMTLLAKMRAKRPGTDTLQHRFQGDIDQLLNTLRLGGEQIIEALDAGEPTDKPLPEQVHRLVRAARSRVAKAVWTGGSADERREFSTLTEAEAFMDRMNDSVVSQLNPLLDYGRSEANKRIQAMAAKVEAEQEAQVHELLERAAEELRAKFDVKLSPPAVRLNTTVEVTLDQPTTRTSSGSYQYTTTENKRVWYNLWFLAPVKVEKTGYYSHTYYVVTKAEVKGRISNVFEGRLSDIRQELTRYLINKLNARLDEYYDRTDQYLQRYHGALSRSQDASRLDEQRKQEYLARLVAQEENLAAELRLLADYREQLAGYENAIS